MMRLQRWENGSYFTAFSLRIPDMRSFLNVREIVKICFRSPSVLLSHTYVRQAARSADGIGAIVERVQRERVYRSRSSVG